MESSPWSVYFSHNENTRKVTRQQKFTDTITMYVPYNTGRRETDWRVL
jgi:hypothetical protein